jgi:signal transduction histidine kinase
MSGRPARDLSRPGLSLTARITLIAATAIIAAWIGVVALYYRGIDGGRNTAWPLPAQVAAIAALVEASGERDRQAVLHAVSSPILHAVVQEGGAPAVAVVESVDADLVVPYRAALRGRQLSVGVSTPSGAPRRVPWLLAGGVNALAFSIGLRDGSTLVLTTRAPIAVSRLGFPVGFGAGLVGTLIALAALIVMHRETRPIARLAAAVDDLDPSGAVVALPVPPGSASEVRVLVAAFNRLQERIDTLLKARMALIGGISHDVRTYATRLRLRVEAIPDDQERERAARDVADMTRLLDDAVLASRAGAHELAQELVEFGEVVFREVEDRKTLGAPVTLAATEAPATVLGDRVALKRIVSNLVDNAIAYGRAAHLRIATIGGEVELVVDDEGRGIPEAHRAVLMEPFVRTEVSRNRRTGGAGLGLTIVRTLTEAHGGRVAISDAPSGGARLRVLLPLYEQPADQPCRRGPAVRQLPRGEQK